MLFKNISFYLILILTIILFACSDDDNPADSTPEFNLQITSTPDTLREVEETVGEVQLNLSDLPPEEGIEVPLDVRASDGSEKPLARFQIESFNPAEDLTGATLVEQPDLSTLNQLLLNMVEQQATITLPVANDEFDAGPLEVSFSIREGESDLFTVNEGEGSTSFTIVEGMSASISATPDTLIETNEETGTITFSLSQEPGPDGLRLPISVRSSEDGSNKPLARFKIASFNEEQDLQGAILAVQPDLSTLNELILIINEQEATLKLAANDDNFDSGPVDVTFTIQEEEGDGFVVPENKGFATFTIVENP